MFLQFVRWARLFVPAVLVLTVLTSTASPASAQSSPRLDATETATEVERQTSDVAPVAAPGAASAGIPGYDRVAWAKTYACAFAGWPRGKIVFWRCELHDPVTNTEVDGHGGSFSNGSFSTPTYYFRSANIVYCTFAYAVYADNSGSASASKCR